MNGFILLIPALTVGQVDAAWATKENVNKEWVLRIDPQVLDWLRDGKYKEVASNIDDREPGAQRLRIRFANGTTPSPPTPEVLTSQTTAEIVANWQKSVDPQTRAEIREFVVQITPALIPTLKTGRYEIVEPIPIQAGAVRQFRLVVVDPALATQANRQPNAMPQPPVTQTAAVGPPVTSPTAVPVNPASTFTPRPTGPVGGVPNNGQINAPLTNGQTAGVNLQPQYQPNAPGNNFQTNLPQSPVGQGNFVPGVNPNFATGNNQQPTTPYPNYNTGMGAGQQPYGAPGTQNYNPNLGPNQNFNRNPNFAQNPNLAPNGSQFQTQPNYNQQQNWNSQTGQPGANGYANQQNTGMQSTFRPNSQVQVAQGPVGQQGSRLPTSTGATTGQRGGDEGFVNRRLDDADREGVNQVSRATNGGGDAPTQTKEATSDFFWLMIFLFLSIGFNVYLVWVAWQTYWKYRDLVADTRSPRAAGADAY